MIRALTLGASLAVFACLGASAAAISSPTRSHAIHLTAPLYCPSYPSGSGILPDGDFSQAQEPNGGSGYGLKKGTMFAPDWMVTGPKTVDFEGLNGEWTAPYGVCTVDLDGTPGPGGILHDAFPTMSGATYTVSFLFSANEGGPPDVKKIIVSVGDQKQSFKWNTRKGNYGARHGDWAIETWQFVASSDSTTLLFKSKDPKGGNWGPVVAAISVTPTSP